jgi:hypothetical protein
MPNLSTPVPATLTTFIRKGLPDCILEFVEFGFGDVVRSRSGKGAIRIHHEFWQNALSLLWMAGALARTECPPRIMAGGYLSPTRQTPPGESPGATLTLYRLFGVSGFAELHACCFGHHGCAVNDAPTQAQGRQSTGARAHHRVPNPLMCLFWSTCSREHFHFGVAHAERP